MRWQTSGLPGSNEPYPSRVNDAETRANTGLYFDFSKATRPAVLLCPDRRDLALRRNRGSTILIWREAVELVGYPTADKNEGLMYFPAQAFAATIKKLRLKRFVSKIASDDIERDTSRTREGKTETVAGASFVANPLNGELSHGIVT